ncbi:MAG: PL29 family lyase N-terminal domain-containing protein [Alistipes sp.]|nr:PL29 family lyase N-terminal domain-containing protein [Alistipes sp.]
MKKLFYLVAAVGMIFTSCEDYDDTGINNKLNELDQRLTELEATVKAMNQDIAGIQTLVDAMQNNVYVSRIVEGETGYEVFFTNGESITISNGKDGEAGKDGVTVTIMLDETDGQYYWAVTKDGVTSFIEVDGKRILVKGDKGNTPLMRVVMEGETGYWEVSYDNGQTYERVLLPDGTPVTTSGGAGGLFKEAYVDEETNTAVFVFLNGETLEIELRSEMYIRFAGEEQLEKAAFRMGETREFQLEAVGVLKTVVTTPDEWNASYDKATKVLKVTAPAESHANCADLEGELALIYFGDENQSSVLALNVYIGKFISADESALAVDATKDEATYEVAFTTDDDELEVVASEAWLSGVVEGDVVKVTVAANTGAERVGTVAVKADDNEIVITVTQAQGVALQEHGMRLTSPTALWNKPISEIVTGATSIAALGDYLVVSAPKAAPVVLNALTGVYVGTIDLGEMAGANEIVTADDAGNLVVSSFAEAGGFRIGRMKGIDGTLEVFITRESQEYGKDMSVIGDVYGDARITLMYSPWSSGTTGHLLYQVSGGVADGGTWSKIAAGSITDKIDNNNGDVIYRDMNPGAPYFMTGYSSNCFVWAEGGTAQAIQVTTNSNCGAVCIDVEKFNGAYYLATACDTYFTWALTDAAIYMADVTSLAHFQAGVVPFSTGALEWNVASAGGTTDVALRAAKDGVHMYVYVLHGMGSVGCVQTDCLAE